MSMLTCDGSACRSTLLRAGLGIQVCLNADTQNHLSHVFSRYYQATLFTPQPLSIATADNPVLGLHAVSSFDAATDEFIVISYEVSFCTKLLLVD
jgi:hypothetical protein